MAQCCGRAKVAMDDTGVYVVGGGRFDAPNTSEAFLARLEKAAAVVTEHGPPNA
jgi:hypothetical protein